VAVEMAAGDQESDRFLSEGRVGIPHVEIERGPFPTGKKVIRLKLGTMTIGRDIGVDLLFSVDGVSRRHAKLVMDERGAVTLYDMGSTNGTFVNERKVEIAELREGDRIEISEVCLRFARDDPRYRQKDSPGGSSLIDLLSAREREIAELVAEGISNAEIGQRLSISARTVGTHLANVYERIGIHNRTALTKLVLEHSLAPTSIKKPE
jgi:DNA-binding CsgD family transcriptional regulator